MRDINKSFLLLPVLPLEFHISNKARKKYEFDDTLFASNGNVVFADFRAAQKFVQKINAQHAPGNEAVKASQINAAGLLDEVLHHVVFLYKQQINANIFEQALDTLNKKIGRKVVDSAITAFVAEFPPRDVYKGKISLDRYLRQTTAGVSNKQYALEEMLMLWLTNENQGLLKFEELFSDKSMRHETAYRDIIKGLKAFFRKQSGFGPDALDLISLLRQPALASPTSLEGQLRFIKTHWSTMIANFMLDLLKSLDFIKEEEKPRFFGPGPADVVEFDHEDAEAERFSQDRDWMPRLVLLAKSIVVWLAQLSKKYHRELTRLDQIPDEELDELAEWGFTGLWLIGLWERSPASKKIKQLCGNPEAEASAYSLFDYQVAQGIGGWEALENLKSRCLRRGIRLACDMVPNHMGIDSKWLREHPDWFISSPYSPFPTYTFNGPNLSKDARYGIFIEDKYYDQSDAAVVFKRQDYHTGEVQYIYHGNDGTHMPWNDTAQLNFLHPEVRESVIQTILNVARAFSIIRFDAAMVLSKKHYQRLWFPEPGSGGDIPSRAEHGISKQDFNQAMPDEFWREVVDRVAHEVPDTLLLAEAFWLMEGYFVRSLGMHRVYNSAFMNMLKNEENQEYRNAIKNTIQFNPQILKRFVNFLNNPDEETAIVQFGKEDKYFGACTMLVTMPGLPMIGHGQIEGFAEKYGMEYRRPYWDEAVDSDLVRRHEREIFPLMRKRHLFADVSHFLLFDFLTTGQGVNENIFAYFNRAGDDCALVAYNNKFEHTSGWIHMSAAYAVRGPDQEISLVKRTMGETLDLHYNENNYCLFRDEIAGLDYIRNSKDILERGLYLELGAYKYCVFSGFAEIQDDELRRYQTLAARLQGQGVESIGDALKEIALRPLLDAFESIMNPESVNEIFQQFRRKKIAADELHDFEIACLNLLEQAKRLSSGKGDPKRLAKEVEKKLKAALKLPELPKPLSALEFDTLGQHLLDWPIEARFDGCILLGWLLLHQIGRLASKVDPGEESCRLTNDWLLEKPFIRTLRKLGGSEPLVADYRALLRILLLEQNWFADSVASKPAPQRILTRLFDSPDVRHFLEVNQYAEVFWYKKEKFETLVGWLHLIATMQSYSKSRTKDQRVAALSAVFSVSEAWLAAARTSGYQLEKLLEITK